MDNEKIIEAEIKNEEASSSAKDINEVMLQKLEKQVFFTKLIAVFTGLTCVAVLLVACILIPPVMKTLNSAQAVMNTANTTMSAATSAIEAAEKSLDNVETMSNSIIDTSNQLNAFVTENAESMSKAMDELSNINFKGLNEAIVDLQDAVGPFASLMRKFQ